MTVSIGGPQPLCERILKLIYRNPPSIATLLLRGLRLFHRRTFAPSLLTLPHGCKTGDAAGIDKSAQGRHCSDKLDRTPKPLNPQIRKHHDDSTLIPFTYNNNVRISQGIVQCKVWKSKNLFPATEGLNRGNVASETVRFNVK